MRLAPIASGAMTPVPPPITVQPMVRTRKKVPMNSAMYLFMPGFLRETGAEKQAYRRTRRRSLLKGEQIAQTVARPLQAEATQTGRGGAFPVALGIVAGVQCFIRLPAAERQCSPINFRIRFVGAQLAGKKDVREIFCQAEMLQDHSKPAIEV